MFNRSQQLQCMSSIVLFLSPCRNAACTQLLTVRALDLASQATQLPVLNAIATTYPTRPPLTFPILQARCGPSASNLRALPHSTRVYTFYTVGVPRSLRGTRE